MSRPQRYRAAALVFAVFLAACADQPATSGAAVEQVETRPPVHSFAPDGARVRTDEIARFEYPKNFKVSLKDGSDSVVYRFKFGVADNAVINTERVYFWRVGHCTLQIHDRHVSGLTGEQDAASLQAHLLSTLWNKDAVQSGEPFMPDDPTPSAVTARVGVPYIAKIPDSLKTVLGAERVAQPYIVFLTGQIIDLGEKRALMVCDFWEELQFSAMRLLDRVGETLAVTEETKGRTLSVPISFLLLPRGQG